MSQEIQSGAVYFGINCGLRISDTLKLNVDDVKGKDINFNVDAVHGQLTTNKTLMYRK